VLRGSQARRGRGRLPAETTLFLGRDLDVAEVKRLLSAARLVTLTGVGGIGKSRLALRVAADLRPAYPDGAWLVDVAPAAQPVGAAASQRSPAAQPVGAAASQRSPAAQPVGAAASQRSPLTDPSWLELAVAEAFGIGGQTNRPPAEVVTEYLSDRELLLVLDNCEHLLDACACLVDMILRHCPGVRVLCTSRQAVGTVAEHIWEVEPLPEPAGLALFVDRAAASGVTLTPGDRDTATDVCRRLDGLPLAIELAAAQLRTRTLAQLDAGLGDRFRLLVGRRAKPAHHRTLASTFDWSFTLCSEPEQALWTRLSVFHDSFPAEAAGYVCAPELPPQTVTALLCGLLDKSVLVRAEERYRLLETVRQYGRDRLPAGDRSVLGRRHRDWYLDLARQFSADWFGPRQAEWLVRMRLEQPNLRAALDYSLSKPGEAAAGLELASCLVHFWYPAGLTHEGRYWLQRALDADPAPTVARGYALAASAHLGYIRGELFAAGVHAREAARIARRLRDPRLGAAADRSLGMIALMGGDLPTARTRVRQALAGLARLGEDGLVVAEAYLALALTLTVSGQLAQAAEACRECRVLCESHGDRWWLAHTYSAAARIALAGDDLETATEHTGRALKLAGEVGEVGLLAVQVERSARLAGRAGDHQRAAVLLGAADRMWLRPDRPVLDGAERLRVHEAGVAAARAALGPAGFAAEFARGAAMTPAEAAGYALGEEPAAVEPPPAAVVPAPVPAPKPALTRRERQVAELIGEGLTNRQIAGRLGTSQRTAESHVENILRKLGFAGRTQVAAWVVRESDVEVSSARAAAGPPPPPSTSG
jgi:predicted ATPase/DNA-binding CsgD family transcriptional regulator